MADAKPDEKKDAVTDNTGDTSQGGGEKIITMTQREFDEKLQERLARDRRARGEEIKTAEEKAAEMKAKLEEATKTIETLKQTSATVEEVDKVLKEVHAGLLEGIPEEKRTLVPESLSLAEQVKFINRNKAHLFSEEMPVKFPKTPDSDRITPEGKASDIPGGYQNVVEFAKSDPMGYAKWRKEKHGVNLR